MTGAIINAGAIILGSAAGLALSSRLPERITKIVFQALGLFTLFLGIDMAGKTDNFLVMALSITLGSIIGESLDLDKVINNLSEAVKRKIKLKSDKFSEGFITSSLIFCTGSMAILGAIEEGLGGKPSLLLTKAVLDGFASICFSASLGIGAMFSALPVFVYQGGLTLAAGFSQGFFTEPVVNELSAVGGLLLVAVGMNILGITKIKTANFLPGLVVAASLAYLFL